MSIDLEEYMRNLSREEQKELYRVIDKSFKKTELNEGRKKVKE